MSSLLIKNIGLLQTPAGSFSHRGKAQGENLKLKDAAILIKDGIIQAITDGGKLPCSPAEADMVFRRGGSWQRRDWSTAIPTWFSEDTGRMRFPSSSKAPDIWTF
ncbi:MAG: hypothetical protein ACLTK0_06010 [Anaerovoracaceae bacterium]